MDAELNKENLKLAYGMLTTYGFSWLIAEQEKEEQHTGDEVV